MIGRLGLAALAVLAITAASRAGDAPAATASPPQQSVAPAMSPADAAKAKRAALRQCKRECDRLYPVQIRTVGEGQALQRTEIVGNVAAHDQCNRACDQGLPAQ